MAKTRTWDAASIEMIAINSDTPIPRRILHTHTPTEPGLNGRVHNKTKNGKTYRYYYPGILDSLLYITFPHQLHTYLLPAIHAGKLEKWCLEQKLKPYRFKVLPSGKYAEDILEQMKTTFYDFLREADEEDINKLRWVSNSCLAPAQLINSSTPILNQKIVAKMWYLDWTPGRMATLEFIERHGLDIEPSKLEPEDEIRIA